MPKAAVSPRHPCPGGCGRMIAPTMLACPYHWRLVPEPLRAEVWQAWRARTAAPRDAAAIAVHHEVVTRAAAAIREAVARA